jgi:hypothetical protein
MAGTSIISTLVTVTVDAGQGSYAADLTITNTGAIQTSNTIGIDGGPGISGISITNDGTVSANINGISLEDGGYVTNSTGALISGGTGVSTGALGTVLNNGIITGTDYGIFLQAGGYVTNSTGGLISGNGAGIFISTGAGTVLNSGTIAGTQAIGIDFAAASGVITNNAGALISGHTAGIFFTHDSGTVLNAGTISDPTGDGIVFSQGGYVNNGTAAVISAHYFAIYTNGALGTMLNAGTIISSDGTGIQLDMGGYVTNSTGALISGAEGAVYVRTSAGTVLNAGTILSSFGTGAYLHNGGYVSNSGTAAVISGQTGVFISHAAGTVLNTGTISGTSADGGGVEFNAGGNVTNSGAGALISGNFGVNIENGVGTVVNTGTITGNFGVALGMGGYIANTGTAALIHGGIDGVYFTGTLGSVLNAGTITGGTGYGVDLSAGGFVTNTAGALISNGVSIYAYAGVVGGVLNIGAINNAHGRGVYLGSGTVTNSGTGALIAGYASGVALYGPGTVLNSGTITSTNNIGVFLRTGGEITNSGTGALIFGANDGVYTGGNAGTVLNGGTISGNFGVYLAAGGYIDNSGTAARISGAIGVNIQGAAGTVLNTGTISASSVAGVNFGAGGTVIDSGLISGSVYAINFGTLAGTLIVEHGARLTGDVLAATSTANLLEFAGTTASYRGGIGTQLLNFNNISFATGAVWSIEGNISGLTDGAINGFTGTDTIELAGFTATSETYVSGKGLELNNGTSTVTLDITGSFTTGSFTISDTAKGTQIIVCYLRGTKILTPRGEVAIETLRIGDPVVTRFQGIQPVKWVGMQNYSRRFIQNNHDRVPVRIKAGALGRALPARDLWVSPGHSMLIGNQLVLAKSLVNGVTVTQDFVPEEVHYYQIELETHNCIQAEGAWSETYADCPGMRAQFQNAASFHELYPDFIAPSAPQLCAERPAYGPALDAALRPIVALAEAATTPGAMLGWVDKIDESGNIEGWAHDSTNPQLPVLLAIFMGGTVVGTLLAGDYRADLEAAGFGHGRCSFTYRLPHGADFGAVQIRRLSDGAILQLTEAAAKSRRPKVA